MSILEANNVSIRYITGDFKEIGIKEYLIRRIKHNYHVEEFWADKDISFTLERGEMLGIIGANGAESRFGHYGANIRYNLQRGQYCRFIGTRERLRRRFNSEGKHVSSWCASGIYKKVHG